MTSELFQRIAEAIPGIVYLMTADFSRYLYINPPIERLLGYPAEKFLREGPAFTMSLTHPEDLERITRNHNERLAQLNISGADVQDLYTHIDEYRVRHRDGSWRWIRSSGIVFERTESGEILTVLGVAQDITEQRELEQRMRISERMASVGRLAAGMAHGINNPLAHLIGSLELVSEQAATLSTQELRARVAGMHASATRIAQIVRDLNIFSRPEDDERLELVSLEEAFESILPIAMGEIRPRARLVRDFGRELPRVLANGSRLSHVFLDLVVNAAQAIPDGNQEQNEIRLTTRLSGDGYSVVAEVRDSGIGMVPSILKQIFDPFFTTKPVGKGMGLGLAIAFQVVQSFGGSLEAESLPGEGSVFRVIMPLPASQNARRVEPARDGEVLGHGRESEFAPQGRILVLDDDATVAEIVQGALCAEHEVVVCTRVSDALGQLCKDREFDLILCDMIMPDKSGAEFYEDACKVRPELVGRFVFMTGGAFTPQTREFLEKANNPTLNKPFRVQAIRALVRDFIQERRRS